MNPEDYVCNTNYKNPKTVLLLYDQEPFWSTNSWLWNWANRLKDMGSSVILISSQRYGEKLDWYIEKFNWKHIHYQHHYVASRDWFRGYRNHPFLLDPLERQFEKQFVCYNRLFAENRPHRINILKELYDNDLLDKTVISFPEKDPLTNQTYADITGRTDIQKILPLVADNHTHSNQSFSLDVQTANKTAFHLVTETVYDIHENYISEKSFKPIVLKQPFIVLGPRGSLRTLQSIGFKTFGPWINEMYDDVYDPDTRLEYIMELITKLSKMSVDDLQKFYKSIEHVLEYNYQHFFKQETLDQILQKLFSDIRSTVIPHSVKKSSPALSLYG